MSLTPAMTFDRYVRQMRYAPIGEEGQLRLSKCRALVVGCGALGTVLANTLVRSGVGKVRIVDRDFSLRRLRDLLADHGDLLVAEPLLVEPAGLAISLKA